MSARPYRDALELLTDLGGHVKRARHRTGASQRELAQRLGISQSALHYAETGERFPRDHTLFALLAWLDEARPSPGPRRTS